MHSYTNIYVYILIHNKANDISSRHLSHGGVMVARFSFQHWKRQRQIEAIKHCPQTVMGGI